MRHDPGGKVYTPLPEGMLGGASFCMHGQECHRHWLMRNWSAVDLSPPFALFIGMNPSTADAEGNDPTVAREIGFTTRLGFKKMIKLNVSDYRATKPRDLLKPGIEISTNINSRCLEQFAGDADMIIAAWGAVLPHLRPHVEKTKWMLRQIGKPVYCLGRTADGSPRHPLYLPADAALLPFNLEADR